MIVNAIREGWEVIYQQAHAILAAEIAYRWRRDLSPQFRFVETLAAIAQHDDGQTDWCGHDGLTPAGAPADFMLNNDRSLEQARRVLHEARFQGRWRSFLTSMHVSFLYEPIRGQDPDTDVFLDEQRSSQEQWRQELGIGEAEGQAAYDFMQWCDRFSLILCRNELPDGERLLEVSRGPDGRRYDVLKRPDGTVLMTPWPFDSDRLELAVEICVLTQLRFDDDAQLADALRQAPIRTKCWTLAE